MFSKEELESLLSEVGASIEKPLEIYMIGGCALSFKGLKEATNDIDIIVTNKKDFNVFDKAMKEKGFQSMADRKSEFYLTALAVYKKEESRIDVFLKQVGKMIFLTKSMIKRAEIYKKYNKMDVYLISNEDIFLFKTMTSREGDVFDCERIMRENINYEVIYNEIVEQSKEEGKRWFFWVYESLCRLEDHNSINTPLKKKVFVLVKKYWNERPDDFMGEINNLDKHISEKKLLKEIKQKSINTTDDK